MAEPHPQKRTPARPMSAGAVGPKAGVPKAGPESQGARLDKHVEAELVERARAGDRDAFERLAISAMPRLLGTATRMLGAGFAAEEVVAEALFRAYRHVARFRGSARFSTWLHRIVCRVVADRFRKMARDRRLVDRLIERQRAGTGRAGGPLAGQAAFDRLSQDETATVLRRAANELPPTQRLVLLLHAWEGLALREIAGLLTLRYATVKSHLHHARTTLRARLAAGDLDGIELPRNGGRR